MALEKCDVCGKVAEWFYMPGSGKYCDDCVPRGCSCNEYHKDEFQPDDPSIVKWNGDYWYNVDDKGRPHPCCEYEYEEGGWDYSQDLDEDEQKK